MIIPRIKKEKALGFSHTLPEILSVYTCDSPGEKAYDVLRIFLPTVIFVKAARRADAHIVFECRPAVTKNSEKYEIHAGNLPITVHYRAFPGARNAASTLAQLLRRTDGGYTLEAADIEDEPDCEIRSILLDSARTLIPVPVMKDNIIRLALAKYNLIHFHLSDSQGLAFKSDVYPQIDGPHHEQYTKAELREIIEFGERMGIEFMPEIEFPAHASRILHDLPELACKPIHDELCPWVMCAGSEATYTYLENIYTELAEIFQNSRFIHVGTDEIAMMDRSDTHPVWHDCAVCRAMCEREGIDSTSVTEIFYYMLRRVYGIITKLGRRMVMWNDNIDIAKSPELPRDILILFWRVAGKNRGPREGCSMRRFLEEGFECLNSYYPECYIERDFYANNDETIRRWTPVSFPTEDPGLIEKNINSVPIEDPALAAQVLGGGPCAWGEENGLGHFMWSLPSSILLYGDRLWNTGVCEDREAFGRAATRWALGIDTPDGFDVYREFGGFMQPRSIDGTRMWADRAAADLKDTEQTLKALVKPFTYTGRLAGEYVRSIEWLNKQRADGKE